MGTPQTTATLTVKNIIKIISFIVSITFVATVAYSSIGVNTKDISDMKLEVKKIPVIEAQIEFLVKGMERLTNTNFE